MVVFALLPACELLVISPSGDVDDTSEDGSKGEIRPEVEEARGLREEVYHREWDFLAVG